VAEGIDFFARALEISARGSTAMLEAFYGILPALDGLPQARDMQLALCQQALAVFPFDAQLLCAMGSYLERQGRIDLACRSFEAATRFGQVDPQTWHLIEIADVATVCHATSLDLLGDVSAARRALETALAARPDSMRLRRPLLELYIRHDLRREALEMVNNMPAETPHREALRSAVRGACLAAKQNWIPALAYLQIARGSGCRDSICFRGLVTSYLGTGDLTSAERSLDEWQQTHGANAEILRLAGELNRLRSASAPQQSVIGMPAANDRIADRNLRLDAPSQSSAALAPKSATRSSLRSDSDTSRN
jgi:tetratricopeptide (TPR) repeat protein